MEPRPVQRLLESPGDGVCRGGREVLPCAAGLPRTGVQQVVEGGALLEGLRLFAVVVIDGVLPLHGFSGGLQKQPSDGGLALAGVLGQQLHHIIAQRLGLLIAPQLPVSSSGHFVHLADAPGNVPENRILHLLPEGHEGVRGVVEVVRGQHQAPPPKVSSGWRFSVRASSASLRASSSEMPYRAERYL